MGRYRIEQRLGSGAMGEVYLGVDEGLGRGAALKFLGTQHLGNETLRERFLREARAIARLSHPNLITIFEAGEHEGRPYYAMELLEGGDTMQLLVEQTTLRPGVVASIGAQAATGLAEAARVGIIHRDIKPSNLGINARGAIKVTDFGLAKSNTREQSLTGKGLVVGTADYIAPEQARGEKLDERVDVYALGCTLYHLLAGRPPYRHSDDAMQSYMEVIQDHIQAAVPDVRERVPGVDDQLANVLLSCMAKSREDRPTLDELGGTLLRVAARIGGEIPRLSKRAIPVVGGGEGARRAGPRPAVARPPAGGVARLAGEELSEDSLGGSDSVEQEARALQPRWPRVVAVLALAGVLVALAALYLR